MVLKGEGYKQKRGQERGRKGEWQLPLFILFLDNRFDRTYFDTASAVRAFFFVDRIGFTLFNCICRTFLHTGTARHAFFGDRIGHFPHPLFL